MADFSALTTETRNLASEQIDRMSALEIATCINREDKTVALAVEKCLPQVAACIDLMADPQTAGGLLVAMPPEKAHAVVDMLKDEFPWVAIVGEVIEKQDVEVILK